MTVATHPDVHRPIKWLRCCCCGASFQGRQFHNQDTGYGLGDCCVEFVRPRVEDMERVYGVSGVHYNLKSAQRESAAANQTQGAIAPKDRVFVGCFPAGLVYADRLREKHGDYAKLAFLSFATLELTVEKDCTAELKAWVEADAAQVQVRRGQQFEISTCGQTVTLGEGR